MKDSLSASGSGPGRTAARPWLPRRPGRPRRVLWLVLLAGLLLPALALAKARVAEPVVELRGEEVWVSFRLENGFDDELQRRLESGLPATIVYRVQLMRDRLRWADKLAESRALEVVATYDAGRREYLVHTKLDGELVESRLVMDAAELPAAMTELGPFKAFSTTDLTGDRRILVRVRAELGTRTLFFFFPSTVSTDWAESAKHHLPGLP